MVKTKMVCLTIALLLCISSCTARPLACGWYPSPNYIDVAMKCSGEKVIGPPIMLSTSLKLFIMNETLISSLDSTTFAGRDLQELTTLFITHGILTSVGAHAFCSLPNLRNLDLSDNQLVLIDKFSLICNTALTSVSLANNPSLKHFPRLVSSSVETLYLDYTSLENVDVADFEGLTALKILSLLGDPNCPYYKSRFEEIRPDVLVWCDDPSSDLPSPLYPGDKESTTQNSVEITPSTAVNTKSAASGLSPFVSSITLVFLSLVIFIFYI